MQWLRSLASGPTFMRSESGSRKDRASGCASQVKRGRRIGLHSLPQANSFYANACGMTDLGQDATYENLRYFELDSDSARRFIEKGKGE